MWNKRLQKAISKVDRLVKYDHLYIGGGNAKLVKFQPDAKTIIVSNEAGIRGGIVLWQGAVKSAKHAS